MASSGIRFNDCFFTEPVDLSAWIPPKYAGLFAIVAMDPNWAPKAFQPLYFGEFGNNSPASAILSECNRVRVAATGKHLLVSIFPMPFSTTQHRWALRNELVCAYNPVYQTETETAHRPDLAYQLAELERKHQEQTAQMRNLLAGMNGGLETPPARRRRIGFLPLEEPAAD